MPNHQTTYPTRLVMIILFAVAMACVEAAVVVYLRELFYPDGFALPLKELPDRFVVVEVFREAATLIMLGAVAVIAGRPRWDRFGWFITAFGTWDIFYYVWLKVTVDWPASLTDWDILFLIPLPWIGPVIAPVSVATLMVIFGVIITRRFARGGDFRPTGLAWLAAVAGSLVILYSFMSDTEATLRLAEPQPYRYYLLVIGLACYVGGFVHALKDR